MPPTVTRRRNAALAALAGLLILAAPLALVIHAASPKHDAAEAPAIRGLPVARPLSASCARTAHDAQQLAAQFGAATAGQTICLTSGDYGKFIAGGKPGMVGIRARAGARVRLAIDFESVAGIRLSGVTITHALISGASHDITIDHSRFTGLAVVLTDRMLNAHILFDHNVHANIDTCPSCYQGRLHIEGAGGQPTGIVVRDSVFSGGDSDGVRADADGIKIIGNEFFGLRDRDPYHTDPIQLYGGTHVLIRGNYFHDNAVSAQIMMADGSADDVVEDNVVSGGGYTFAVTWFADRDSIIRHNTFADTGACQGVVRCGMLNLGAKATDSAGRGTVIRDNVMGGITNHGGAKYSAYVADHNLTALPTAGAHNIVGVPSFRGPPAARTGYRLAARSAGAGRASDGSDPGIR